MTSVSPWAGHDGPASARFLGRSRPAVSDAIRAAQAPAFGDRRPATTIDDVDRHTEVFGEAVRALFA